MNTNEEIEELNYIPKYQSLLFENSKDPADVADATRKCLVQAHTASLLLLNTETALEFTKLNLENYANNDIENIYQKHITGNVKDRGYRCNLKNINIESFLTPLPCSVGNNIQCQNEENINEEAIQEFVKIFNQTPLVDQNCGSDLKGKRIAKNFAPRCCAPKNSKIFKTTTAVDTSVASSTLEQDVGNDTKEVEVVQNSFAFKTAREELNLQNSRKFGTRPVSQTQLNAQKRKLGTRRTFQNKFVSPMLSNNSDEQLPKSDEWPVDQEIDERLKNIEPRMVELIRSEIMDNGTPVDWDDIAGLEFAKTAIQEAVVWPLLRPDIFTGLRRPPKGILLFGPPGTGKTLIGKCVASQSKSTFFSISASSLTSKWIGDGEKMVRALFAVARCHQPAVIFIDEIDSLLSQRSETEHESSRRIKTEFLVQLDGATTDNEERILVIGATNRPQELDEAARRRFVKRLYIPLPELEARLQLVTRLMASEKHSLLEENIKEIARLSDGYSGADMKNLCSEASLGPIRCIDIKMMQSIQSTEVRPVSMEDFIKALSRVKSSVSPKDLEQYLVWNTTYGSGGGF